MNPLSDMRSVPQYQQERKELFPSIESLRWFIRQHRGALERTGALGKWRGELLLDARKADDLVVEVFARSVRPAPRLRNEPKG